MRRAFTLIELLTVVAIIAIMVTAGVASIRGGQGAVRVKGAARDIFAVIRHARSVALVSQQPSVVTYSTKTIDGEVCAQVDVRTATIMEDTAPQRAKTLKGEDVVVGGTEEELASEPAKKGSAEAATEAQTDGEGLSVGDVLFAPVSSDVLRGIRLKVVREGEELNWTEADEEKEKPKISVFSNVDYLIGKLGKKLEEEKKAEAAKKEESSTPEGSATLDDQEPVSFAWEANGRTEPHRVYVFRDGTDPEKGLCIKVDRFGGAKVLGAGEEDDDD